MYTSDKVKGIMIKLTILTITGLVLFGITNAYADHVDNNIWIETADGIFVTANESTEEEYSGTYIDVNTINNIFINKDEYRDRYTSYDDEYRIGYEYTFKGEVCAYDIDEPKTARLNNVVMFEKERGCGSRIAESEYLQSNLASGISMTLEKYHECACGYWYNNIVKDEYTYTILDLPKDAIELPPNYKENVAAGIKDGLEQWGDINDIDFTYTDNRLNANIIIQQQSHSTVLGNAITGCLFNNNQCTIQLFTHLFSNDDDIEALVNRQSIEFTVAHEFGHLIGLPHHIDPEHVMNTIHGNNVRTYYEVGGITVPTMIEPTTEERILLRIIEGKVYKGTPHATGKTTTDRTTTENTPTTSSDIREEIENIFGDTIENVPHIVRSDIDNFAETRVYQLFIQSATDRILDMSIQDMAYGIMYLTVTVMLSITENVFDIIDTTTTDRTITDHSTTTILNRATVLNAAGSSVPGCEETNDCFIPSTVTINTGGEVVWKNVDNAAHTVTSGVLAKGGPDGVFDSGLFIPDTEFSYVFDTPGEYPYFCLVHPWSSGMVIVQEAASDDVMDTGTIMTPKEASAMSALSDGTSVMIMATKPIADEQMRIDVVFEDSEHVNYDIVVMQGDEVVLNVMGSHQHKGMGSHQTSHLPTGGPVDITITFKGYGIDEMTGPINEEIVFVLD